jgi:hypothetical protein
MILPFDRERLMRRNTLDAEQEVAACAEKTSSQSFMESVEVSEVVRQLAIATGSESETSDLEAKSRLYVSPLLAATRT